MDWVALHFEHPGERPSFPTLRLSASHPLLGRPSQPADLDYSNNAQRHNSSCQRFHQSRIVPYQYRSVSFSIPPHKVFLAFESLVYVDAISQYLVRRRRGPPQSAPYSWFPRHGPGPQVHRHSSTASGARKADPILNLCASWSALAPFHPSL